MKQEDRKLLIKDLCARLPYDVAIKYGQCDICIVVESINTDIGIINDGYLIEVAKPYLFPMSSMTEEQRNELYEKYGIIVDSVGDLNAHDYTSKNEILRYFDWLNEHHFDYRGLIDKGLAIDATNLNIYEN